MDYRLARCCSPAPRDNIVGFLKSDEDLFSVHRADCPNLQKIAPERLVDLSWEEVSPSPGERTQPPASLLAQLDSIDWAILRHHQRLGVDYAAVVGNSTGVPRAEVFLRHRKLRDLGLLRRVEARIIRYRQGIVEGKWIKHRNHTYYELTSRGAQLLDDGTNEKSS